MSERSVRFTASEARFCNRMTRLAATRARRSGDVSAYQRILWLLLVDGGHHDDKRRRQSRKGVR